MAENPIVYQTVVVEEMEVALVGWKTLFALKPCVVPIFCVIIPSIYQMTK
jgi:hypothetical protein